MKWVRLLVAVAAWSYPALVLAIILALRFVGERSWPTGLALYLPRLPWVAPIAVLALLLVITRQMSLLWTQAAAGLLVLFPLMGLAIHWRRVTPPGPTIRIFSYNVNSSHGGAPGLIAEVDRYRPDIVVFQEAWSSRAAADLLRARYPTVQATYQFVLAARYPVVSRFEPKAFDDAGRPDMPHYLEQILDTSLGRIALYNVHPISPRHAFSLFRLHGLRRALLSGAFFSAANGAALLQNARVRETQASEIAREASHEGVPVIIAGDTNLPGLSAIAARSFSAYQDGFVEAGSGFGYTFPADGFPWMRIDRILAGPAFRFVHFEVGASRASDHLCVVADLALAP